MSSLNIFDWLNARGISDDIIDYAGIVVKSDSIVIPVHDVNGKILFNKYRALPGQEGDRKYWYDAGSQTALYNIRALLNPTCNQVIICEGELDALLLLSKGYCAVTSTGGAGSFKKEWIPYFKNRSVYILLDLDQPGTDGAMRTASLFPEVRVVFLPDGTWKDITDYFQDHTPETFESEVLGKAMTISSWQPAAEPKTKKEVKAAIRRLNMEIETFKQEALRVNKGRRIKPPNLNFMANHFKNQKAKLNRLNNKDQEKAWGDGIAKAKAVPLETLYAGELKYLGNRASGICPFHYEDTPSFTIYVNENRWHCFGCDAGHDAIDFIMRRDDCDFKTAVATLLKQE